MQSKRVQKITVELTKQRKRDIIIHAQLVTNLLYEKGSHDMTYYLSVYVPMLKSDRPLQWASNKSVCIFQSKNAAQDFLKSLKAIQPKLRANIVCGEVPGMNVSLIDMTGKVVRQDVETGNLFAVTKSDQEDQKASSQNSSTSQ